MPIHFTCPHCGTATEVADEYVGQTGPCAHCGQTITVPSDGTVPIPARPVPKSSAGPVLAIVLVAVPVVVSAATEQALTPGMRVNALVTGPDDPTGACVVEGARVLSVVARPTAGSSGPADGADESATGERTVMLEMTPAEHAALLNALS